MNMNKNEIDRTVTRKGHSTMGNSLMVDQGGQMTPAFNRMNTFVRKKDVLTIREDRKLKPSKNTKLLRVQEVLKHMKE